MARPVAALRTGASCAARWAIGEGFAGSAPSAPRLGPRILPPRPPTEWQVEHFPAPQKICSPAVALTPAGRASVRAAPPEDSVTRSPLQTNAPTTATVKRGTPIQAPGI